MKRLTNVLFSAFTIILSALLTLINFSEWYIVKNQGRRAEYPFGGEGPTPYFYKTAELYSTISLIWGTVFLTFLVFTIWTIVAKKKKWTAIAFGSTILLLLGLFIHGKIGKN